MRTLTFAAVLAGAAALLAVPTAAEAKSRHHNRHSSVRVGIYPQYSYGYPGYGYGYNYQPRYYYGGYQPYGYQPYGYGYNNYYGVSRHQRKHMRRHYRRH